MNCQEVMEYMQRELDGDLGDLEAVKTHEHIRQCAECAAMYERLKRLSAELENLPKVAPPISLVDAILPKLDEIDRVKAAASADNGSPELAGTAGTIARTQPRRRNNRFSLRILSGVVAAGVVAGIFLVTYDRDPLGDSFPGNSAVMESASSDSSGSPMIMMGAATDAGDAAGIQERSAAVMEKAANLGEAADDAVSGPAAEPASGSGRQQASDRSGDSATDAGSESGAISGSGDTAGSGFGSGSSANSGASADSGSVAGEDRISPPDLLAEADGGIGVADSGMLKDDVQMGFTGFLDDQAGPVESVSPDGSWIAVFTDSRVVIYGRDGNARFEGEARQGAIAAMGWSEDGAYFRYEVRREDGTGEIYRIDIAQGTETLE